MPGSIPIVSAIFPLTTLQLSFKVDQFSLEKADLLSVHMLRAASTAVKVTRLILPRASSKRSPLIRGGTTNTRPWGIKTTKPPRVILPAMEMTNPAPRNEE